MTIEADNPAQAGSENADQNSNETPNPGAGGEEGAIINESAGGDEGGQQVPADWPQDWRTKFASGDEKLMKRLERFSSPADVWKSFRALEQKVSSGELKKPAVLPENATAEQVAEYRKENGVPDVPEKYDMTLPDGLVVGEEDKPLVGEFLKSMHAANAPDKFVKSALAAYYTLQEQQKIQNAERDDQTWKATEDALRADFGPEYRRNANIINNYVNSLPDDLRDNLKGARLADNTRLLANEAGVRFVLGLAMEANPVATVVPHSSNPGKSIEDELKNLNVGSDEYWKSPDKQKRYRELTDAQDKMKKKA